MTAKLQEAQPASASAPVAAWVSLVKNSVPGLGLLFEVTGKPWTAWLGILGLVFAAVALLLGGLGMQDDGGLYRNSLQGGSYSDRALRDNGPRAIVEGLASAAGFLGKTSKRNRNGNGNSSPSADIIGAVSSPHLDSSSYFYFCCHHASSPLCDASIFPLHLCTSSNPQVIASPAYLPQSSPANMIMHVPGPSVEAAMRVARDFDLSSDQVQRGVDAFLLQMSEGLSKTGATLSQIPTYVTNVPNGTEKGLYLAVDLGGTNFRVCSIQLRGDSTFNLTQSKVPIPRNMMVASSYKELFMFIAKQIESFLETHHNDHFEATVRRRRLTGTTDQYRREEIFDLGFTFSFPVHQTSINRGTLIRWTKGFDIPDAIGKDICLMLQDAIDELRLPVRVAALVNDTVGTLMARSYTSPGKTKTAIGAIFGTGTNGAYVENLGKITKLNAMPNSTVDASTGLMVVNTEWGSFDNHLSVLPNTKYDQQLDAESVNPGVQMFEKRVSGMFLGEILRRAILALNQDPEINLLQNDGSQMSSDSPLYQIWGIDTSFLSLIEADSTFDLSQTKAALREQFKVSEVSTDDARAIKAIGHAIARRAARLSAIALSAILIDTGRINTDEIVDIGVDGSLVEFYPKFVDYIREAMRGVKGIGEKEQKVRIGIAKDGSGVGAALIALVAHREYGIGGL